MTTSTGPTLAVLTAQPHPTASARIVACAPLSYDDPAPPALDRPPHVRAASGLARLGRGWLIAQDDASFLALRGDDGSVRALPLPPGPGGRRQFSEALGNKADKLDLEAVAALPDGRRVAFGSGSTPRRERLAVVSADGAEATLVDGAPLYATLRAARAFAGSELNVEGATVVGDRLVLFQRGNGAVIDGVVAVNATVSLPIEPFARWLDGDGPLPPLGPIVQHELGEVGGVPFGFTDAAALPDGRILFAAGAEDSPDTYRDGEVVGARVGVIDGADVRWVALREPDGAPSRRKIEGIAPDPAGLPRAWAVTDVDDPEQPARFCELAIERL